MANTMFLRTRKAALSAPSGSAGNEANLGSARGGAVMRNTIDLLYET